jgi:hypothetical protein
MQKTIAEQMLFWKEKNLSGFTLNRKERRKQKAIERIVKGKRATNEKQRNKV